MKKILDNKYEKIKEIIKNRKEYGNEQIAEEIILLYTTILSYYSAKLDLRMGDNRLIDKILLDKYDTKLVAELKLDETLDSFVNEKGMDKRSSFYNTIDFLNITNSVSPELLKNMKDEYDSGYLATVLNYNQGKLTHRENKKIDKKNQKILKLSQK